MRLLAILFDFDGLLMDTESSMLASWQHEWRQHGLELDTTAFWADHGGDVSQERYADLARAVGPGYNRAASHARRLAFRDELNRGLGLSAGMADWLAQARAARMRLAVASSSSLSWVSEHLSRAGCLEDFDVLAGGDEVAAHKPAPDVYLLALDRLGVRPSTAVAVEDSAHGVAAAKAAGLRCIAIPNSHTDPGRYGAADLVLASAADMALSQALELAGQ
jgi:HAD superfamily hydrolase (TIGR01509 family)